MEKLEQTLSSVEIADMVEKSHSNLIRDIRRYTDQFNEGKIPPIDFFKESTYKDAKGEIRPCYRITKKGCEFIAHKLTGAKGTIFTARYINRFHDMQDALSAREPGLPWFIREYKGDYVMLFRDFKSITGVSLHHSDPFWKAYSRVMIGGFHYNVSGSGRSSDRESFRNKHGFEYDEDDFVDYLYPSGIRAVLSLCRNDRKFKIGQEAYDMIMDGLKAIPKPAKQNRIVQPKPTAIGASTTSPVQINIICQKED